MRKGIKPYPIIFADDDWFNLAGWLESQIKPEVSEALETTWSDSFYPGINTDLFRWQDITLQKDKESVAAQEGFTTTKIHD